MFLLTSSLEIGCSTTFGSFTQQIVANCKKWRVNGIGEAFTVGFWNCGEKLMIQSNTKIEWLSNLPSYFELSLSNKLWCWSRYTQITSNVEKKKNLSTDRSLIWEKWEKLYSLTCQMKETGVVIRKWVLALDGLYKLWYFQTNLFNKRFLILNDYDCLNIDFKFNFE